MTSNPIPCHIELFNNAKTSYLCDETSETKTNIPRLTKSKFSRSKLIHIVNGKEYYDPESNFRRNPAAEYFIAEVDAAVRTDDWSRIDRDSFVDAYTGELAASPYIPATIALQSGALHGAIFLHETCGVPLVDFDWWMTSYQRPTSIHEMCAPLQYLVDHQCPVPRPCDMWNFDKCGELITDINSIACVSVPALTDETVRPIIDLLTQLIDIGFPLPARAELYSAVPRSLWDFLDDRGTRVTLIEEEDEEEEDVDHDFVNAMTNALTDLGDSSSHSY